MPRHLDARLCCKVATLLYLERRVILDCNHRKSQGPYSAKQDVPVRLGLEALPHQMFQEYIVVGVGEELEVNWLKNFAESRHLQELLLGFG